MRVSVWAAPVAVVAALFSASAAGSGVLVPIPPVPGSTATFVSSINNNNLIAGDYVTADGVSHGFFGTLDGRYITFDAPYGQTFVFGLNNNGYITGKSGQTEGCLYNGCEFVRSPKGSISFITKDGSVIDGGPGEIIAHQEFVGFYDFVDDLGRFASTAYYGKGTKWVYDITLPFAAYKERASGINRDGTVVGHFEDEDDGKKQKGFVLKQGVASAYEYPDGAAYNTYFERINKHETITGAWYDTNFTYSRAFVLDLSNVSFKAIDVNGATFVSANGINDQGIVTVNADNNSYIYCPRKATCPLQGRGAVEISDRQSPARPQVRVCEHNCSAQRIVRQRRQVNSAALGAAIARDPKLQRRSRIDPELRQH